MKRIVCLLLALALLMSLCACGKKEPASSVASAPESSVPASSAAEPTPAPTAKPTPEPTPEPEPSEVSSEPEEYDFLSFPDPSDKDYEGTRGPDDPYVLYGIWNGQVKMIELDSGYDHSEIIKLTARLDYDKDGRGYFKAWTEDEDDPILFVYMAEDPDEYWRRGVRSDTAWAEIGDKDCWIMDHFMTVEHEDDYTYSVACSNGLITTLCDHDYVDADGNRFELQFDFEKDTSATM